MDASRTQELLTTLTDSVNKYLTEQTAQKALRTELRNAYDAAKAALGPVTKEDLVKTEAGRAVWEAMMAVGDELFSRAEPAETPSEGVVPPQVIDPEDPKALLAHFSASPTRITEVQLKTGIRADRLSHLLSRLVRQGDLVRPSRGWYALPPGGRLPSPDEIPGA
jgi:hypothetical protein